MTPRAGELAGPAAVRVGSGGRDPPSRQPAVPLRERAHGQGGLRRRSPPHRRPRHPSHVDRRVDRGVTGQPRAGDRARRQRAQAVPLPPAAHRRAVGAQVRRPRHLRRAPRAAASARPARPRRTRPRARPLGRGRRAAARPDRAARGQRRVRARQPHVRHHHAAHAPCDGARLDDPVALPWQGHPRVRRPRGGSDPRPDRPALPALAGPGSVPLSGRGRRGAHRDVGRRQPAISASTAHRTPRRRRSAPGTPPSARRVGSPPSPRTSRRRRCTR